MQYFTSLAKFPKSLHGGVVCIGNFDGVHLGHQAVLARAKALAKTLGGPVIVLLFEPHPRRYFNPNMPVFRLTSLATRCRLLGRAGADAVVALPFNKSMAQRSPEAFVRDILRQALQARAAVAGYDFHFGKGRSGTPQTLETLGARHDIAVHIQPAATPDAQHPPYASTAIRDALQAGQPQVAAQQLGRWWHLEAPVQKGEQRGRQWGFPTANMALGEYLHPAFGVYAVAVARLAPKPFAQPLLGVANLGIRPQFRLNEPLLETYLFDFDDDLYGHTLAVALLAYLRPEAKFDTTAALRAQMDKDSAQARAIATRQLAQRPFVP